MPTIVMLSVTVKFILMHVIMLSVIMLNVVAPALGAHIVKDLGDYPYGGVS
jgi:hypothetical protein